MIDYEDLILARQESIEIAEDNYGWENTGEEELHFNRNKGKRERSKMEYVVTFVQNHVYFVEADDECEAEDKAYEQFRSDMRTPIANTHYDEVIVEEEEWRE